MAAALCSCDKAKVEARFTTVPSGRVVSVRTVEGTSMRILDSVKVSADGSFKYTAAVKKNQPEFFYFYYGDTKLASLLLQQGDKVSVECDTLGNWTVSGSDDCELLRKNEKALAEISAQPSVTLRQYIQYYREMTRFVLANSKSLTVVPVLFSSIGDTPVFSQLADGVIFNNVADSLESVYPDSRYVRMVRNEGAVRTNQMEINNMLQRAEQASYIDLNFDGIEGKPVVLSEVAKKATLLVFWDVTDAASKMYNLEVLKPLYDRYAAKGLEIYQVGLGADKATWAAAVNEQSFPWINVCDPLGRSIPVYNVTSVPSVLLLTNNNMTLMESITPESLDKAVRAAL